jgi:hypothetical protein
VPLVESDPWGVWAACESEAFGESRCQLDLLAIGGVLHITHACTWDL